MAYEGTPWEGDAGREIVIGDNTYITLRHYVEVVLPNEKHIPTDSVWIEAAEMLQEWFHHKGGVMLGIEQGTQLGPDPRYFYFTRYYCAYGFIEKAKWKNSLVKTEIPEFPLAP